jgi:hypothetical protein
MKRLAIILAMGMMYSCSSGSSFGSLNVNWLIAVGDCEESGVEVLNFRLLENGVDALVPFETAKCNRGIQGTKEGIKIEGIPAGTYTLVIEGLKAVEDEKEKTTIELVGVSENVVITDRQLTSIPPVILTLKTATLRLSWKFSNGKMCGTNGISSVQASLIDDLGNEVMPPTVFACELPTAQDGRAPGILITNLPAKEELTVFAYGLDLNGFARFFGETDFDTLPGTEAVAEVDLNPIIEPDAEQDDTPPVR